MLSTATVTPFSFAAFMSAGRSATSKPGLVGDSIQSRVAPDNSLITADVSVTDTKETFKRFAVA